MTIYTQTPEQIVLGNGVLSAFTFNFVSDTASDIVVYYTDQGGNIIELTTAQYGIVINPPPTNGLWGIGGTITYPLSGTPIPLGSYLTIIREVPDTQEVTISNQGIFYPQVVERAMDILCMEIQQIAFGLSRTIQVPLGSNLTPLQYLQQLIAGMITAGGSSPSVGNISTVSTASYTVQGTDLSLLCDATSNAIAVTLPNALASFGRFLNIKKIDSSANAVTLVGTVDGISTYSLNFQNQSVTIQSNGTSWSVL